MTKTKFWNRNHVIDVESDGPHPLAYNMISFFIVSVGQPERRFLGKLAPLHDNSGGIEAARAVSGVS